jgi:hypothetical protein
VPKVGRIARLSVPSSDWPQRIANLARIGFAGGRQPNGLALADKRSTSSCSSSDLISRLTATWVHAAGAPAA